MNEFYCPVCKAKLDLKKNKCSQCGFPYQKRHDIFGNLIIIEERYHTDECLICPFCKSELPFDEKLSKYSDDFDYEDYYEDTFSIDCPYCSRPFNFSITQKLITRVETYVYADKYADYLEDKKEEL